MLFRTQPRKKSGNDDQFYVVSLTHVSGVLHCAGNCTYALLWQQGSQHGMGVSVVHFIDEQPIIDP